MDTTYRFGVGAFDCLVISDGTAVYPSPAQLLFVDAPKDQLGQALLKHDIHLERWHEWVTTYRALVVCTDKHQVLVDTGAGSSMPTTGLLIRNMQAEGITPEQIDTVVLTHAHRDHIGGSLDRDGAPAFPNARYVLANDERDFWISAPDLAHLPLDEARIQRLLACPRAMLPPINEAGQLDLIAADAEVVPGMCAIPAPGHTPGQIAVSVSSEGDELLFTSDALIHPLRVEHPEWYSAVDVAPTLAVSSARRLLGRAVSDGAVVLTSHFPFPGLGHIVEVGDAWGWEAATPAA